jgi:haloacetate dehalogenase
MTGRKTAGDSPAHFDGFESRRIEVDGIGINLITAGRGPAVLLLHGYPQTHLMWRHIAPRLADRFTVVAPDLRGYGDSDKPVSDPRHETYCKRTNARDQVAVMTALGHDRFHVVGHDRGGRVGHRLALDHPDRVNSLAVLDIAPTHKMYTEADRAMATAYWHWFFLIQPADLPERWIGSDPAYYLNRTFGSWGAGTEIFPLEILAEYLRCFSDPATIHASCEDYRAGAGIDLEHDEEDLDRKLDCPVLALWGEAGFVGRHYDVIAAWKERAANVTGRGIPGGHWLPEAVPEETFEALTVFLNS